MQNFLKDKLLSAKLHFLLSVSVMLEPFLTLFQSNDCLLPFMYQELFSLLRKVADRFVRKNVMAEMTSPPKLMKLDISKDSNLKFAHDVEIGFGAKNACKNLKEADVLQFRNDCRKFLVTMFTKLCVKCPLKMKVVRGATCLAPEVMLNEDLRSSRVNSALEEFVDKKHMTPEVADLVKNNYICFCENSKVKEALKAFSRKDDKLDQYLMKLITETSLLEPATLKFFKQLLILFHGNAAVERCFSVNKECLVENMAEDSLIAQCMVESKQQVV